MTLCGMGHEESEGDEGKHLVPGRKKTGRCVSFGCSRQISHLKGISATRHMKKSEHQGEKR